MYVFFCFYYVTEQMAHGSVRLLLSYERTEKDY